MAWGLANRNPIGLLQMFCGTVWGAIGTHSAHQEIITSSVRDSVKLHLIGDVGVGVFLSSGVDSGAVLGAACDSAAPPPHCLTLRYAEFADGPEDESPLARKVATHYGARHTVRTVARTEFATDILDILNAMDQPSIDGINTWFVAKAAKEVGLKVALSGVGGDELFGGYPSFSDVPNWHRRYRLLAAVPGLGPVARALLHCVLPHYTASRPKSVFMLDHTKSWEGDLFIAARALYAGRIGCPFSTVRRGAKGCVASTPRPGFGQP